MLTLVAALLVPALAPSAQHADPDTDGDGLSDFHERHKYLTDPEDPDSDGDGVADGDWFERREYAYTIRTIVQVLPPITRDVLCDDYQDARVLEERDDYVELEVVHYPLNTVASAIVADPEWRKTAAGMREWVDPGPTSNWDAAMRDDLIAALRRDGVDVHALDDKTLVEKASAWLLQHAEYVDGFTTFCATFEDGEARVLPGLEEAAARGRAETGLSNEEQWERELFAEGMFRSGVRGSCTSSAIYLSGCLRALGIPTRTVLAIPVVDGSDEREVAFLGRLSHPGARRTIQAAIGRLKTSWASHTFNEVFVGGRWRRLNYSRLGQNILDESMFGLVTHVATFRDWADGDLARTWGIRQAKNRFGDDVFGGANPYHAITLSDQFGEHCTAKEEALAAEITRLTIEHVYPYHSDERLAEVAMRLDDPVRAGHFLMHVKEGGAGVTSLHYKPFYEQVEKRFTLRADGRPEIRAHAARGYWVNPAKDVREFYLRVEPGELARMSRDVPYALVPAESDGEYQWSIAPGTTVVLPGE